MSLDDLAAQIDQLQAQQSLQSAALKAALEARWTGEDSVDAFVKALMGGDVQTTPQVPLYPDV